MAVSTKEAQKSRERLARRITLQYKAPNGRIPSIDQLYKKWHAFDTTNDHRGPRYTGYNRPGGFHMSIWAAHDDEMTFSFSSVHEALAFLRWFEISQDRTPSEDIGLARQQLCTNLEKLLARRVIPRKSLEDIFRQYIGYFNDRGIRYWGSLPELLALKKSDIQASAMRGTIDSIRLLTYIDTGFDEKNPQQLKVALEWLWAV